MFEIPPMDASITQGDIFDGCPIFDMETSTTAIDPTDTPNRWYARVIVLTQACDIAQQKSTRILVAHVQRAQDMVDKGHLKGAAIKDQVRRGQIFGWYFLPASRELGLPESLVDLRDLHTVPRLLLEGLVLEGKRLGRLVTPYREHLAQHFGVTYMRIGLPEPYETEP